MRNQKQISAAAERNREPIGQVLGQVLVRPATVLEVASGTGQHAAHFAESFSDVVWQPTDADPGALSSIRGWRDKSDLENFLEPLSLDVRDEASWPDVSYDALFCANMIHIAPWSATVGLFALASRVLRDGGQLITYGPYRLNGEHTAPSNEAFNAWLVNQDPTWGVRDLEDVQKVAAERGLRFHDKHAMPANNFVVVFSKT